MFHLPFYDSLFLCNLCTGKENFCLIHVSLIPVLGVVGEQVFLTIKMICGLFFERSDFLLIQIMFIWKCIFLWESWVSLVVDDFFFHSSDWVRFSPLIGRIDSLPLARDSLAYPRIKKYSFLSLVTSFVFLCRKQSLLNIVCENWEH